MIRLYYGLQGGGKTYSMFNDVLLQFKERPRQIYTNIASACIPEAIYFCSVEQLIDLSDGLILLDEVGIVMPAQFWHEVGRDLLVRICQMRHDGLDLWYTCQRQAGVNVNLREQTNEMVSCGRLGSMIIQRRFGPDGKTSLGTKLLKLNSNVYQLYDTHTNISKSGGSVAARSGGARSRAAQREAEQRRQRTARSAKPELLITERWETKYDPTATNMMLQPSREARDVWNWLKVNGYDTGVHWSEQVRREIRRRQWLAKFGLTADDAPIACTQENPWLSGYDPDSVQRRWDEYQEAIAAETLTKLQEKKRGRSVGL